jgi:hypothetical protein
MTQNCESASGATVYYCSLTLQSCLYWCNADISQELWAIQGEVNIRMPKNKGIAGAVVTSGKVINIPDAYKDPRFNQKVRLKYAYWICCHVLWLATQLPVQPLAVLGVSTPSSSSNEGVK